jgi:hypothetical protein
MVKNEFSSGVIFGEFSFLGNFFFFFFSIKIIGQSALQAVVNLAAKPF